MRTYSGMPPVFRYRVPITIRHFQGQYQEQRTITKQKKRKQSKDNEEAFGIENVLLLIVFNDPSKH